jgi:hypothetical protein
VTKKLEDMIASFATIPFEEQLERVRRARSARTLERPVAAVKRVKKEAKKRDKTKEAATKAVMKLTPEMRAGLVNLLSAEQKAELIAKLKAGLKS